MSFNNSTIANITDETEVYNPTLDSGTCIGMTVAPTSGDDSVVDIKVGDVYLVKGLTVMNGTAATPVGGTQKLVVIKGSPIKVTSDKAVDVIVSFLE